MATHLISIIQWKTPYWKWIYTYCTYTGPWFILKSMCVYMVAVVFLLKWMYFILVLQFLEDFMVLDYIYFVVRNIEIYDIANLNSHKTWKFGLFLKTKLVRLLMKWNTFEKMTQNFVQNYYFKFWNQIYIFQNTFYSKLWQNQSHKAKQVVLQIFGWYLKKIAFCKILFGCSTRSFH